jgi:hypothetical protein
VIDIETEIFNAIAQRLRVKYQNIFVTGEYVKAPPSFPCVSLFEVDNVVHRSTRTNSNIENFATVSYEINIYSNKLKGKKSECKEIATIIDDEFMKMGFTRTMLNPIPNEQDATVYRMVGRYRAIVSKQKVIYRR